jgi:hypothetical protein
MRINAQWSRLCVAFLPLLISNPLYARLSAVPTEFTGSAIESFEEFSQADVFDLNNVPIPIFSGQATISGPAEYIWRNGTIGDPATFALGNVTAQAHDGNQGFGTSVAFGTNVISFSTPVSEFGGYWASGTPIQPILFRFYNFTGGVIGTDFIVYSPPNHDGTLQWFGWQSTAPISRIAYAGSWMVNDSLRIETVPEPSTTGLVLTGIVVLLFATRGGRERRSGEQRQSSPTTS